jgi:hypothetical protein
MQRIGDRLTAIKCDIIAATLGVQGSRKVLAFKVYKINSIKKAKSKNKLLTGTQEGKINPNAKEEPN